VFVTIHQPEHLPWLGFFDKLRQAELFVLLDTCQFAKDDFQNRNRIKTANGPTWLTVPVYKTGRSDQTINEVKICNDRNWRQRCWSMMRQSYGRAPYFNDHAPFFADLYRHDWRSLVELNITIITYLAEQFDLGGRFVRASELGISERGPTTVNLAICRAVGASAYLSGRAGRDYLDEAQFAEHGIRVVYQDFQHPRYPQLWGEFAPAMSAVDLLFNCGPTSRAVIDGAGPASGQGASDRDAASAHTTGMTRGFPGRAAPSQPPPGRV